MFKSSLLAMASISLTTAGPIEEASCRCFICTATRYGNGALRGTVITSTEPMAPETALGGGATERLYADIGPRPQLVAIAPAPDYSGSVIGQVVFGWTPTRRTQWQTESPRDW